MSAMSRPLPAGPLLRRALRGAVRRGKNRPRDVACTRRARLGKRSSAADILRQERREVARHLCDREISSGSTGHALRARLYGANAPPSPVRTGLGPSGHDPSRNQVAGPALPRRASLKAIPGSRGVAGAPFEAGGAPPQAASAAPPLRSGPTGAARLIPPA